MAEYLEREYILNAIRKSSNLYVDQQGMNLSCELISAMPAVDVQPVKHSKWDFQGYQLFRCTNCKKIYTQEQLEDIGENWAFPNFCPNCGAKMIKDGEQNE